jgi:transcriptional regulator with XRE-family HTH domain
VNQSIANQIRRARQNKDLSQENMADELGITKGAYSKIERGVTAISVERLAAIAKILDMELNEFFTDKKASSKVEYPQPKFGFATKGEIEELAKMIHTVAGELTKLKSAIQTLQEQQKRKKK